MLTVAGCNFSHFAQPEVIMSQPTTPCDKEKEWSLCYEQEKAYRTSNALDRLMRIQNRYFDRGQHFHGTLESANVRSRSWAVYRCCS